MNNETLELNLIKALGRLQHTAFDKEFLDEKQLVDPELMPKPFFAFAIGQYNFVVNADCFCEVIVDTSIAALPNSPTLLVGLCNIRGVLTPVYQLHKAISVSSPKKNIIFCLGKGDKAIGLLVDNLPASLSLRADEIISDGIKKTGSVLSSLSNRTYFSAQKNWNLLNGETIGEQLLALAHQEQKQNNLHVPQATDLSFS